MTIYATCPEYQASRRSTSKTELAKMAYSRLLFRPPAGHIAQHSCSCSLRSYALKHTPNSLPKDGSQASSLEPKTQELKRDARFAVKVATRVGVSDSVNLWDIVLHSLSTFSLKPPILNINPSLTQRLVERVIVDCRFFSFFAIAGSLLGSVLCFLEGFIMVFRSYFHYFEAMAHKLDHTNTVELLVEAIDMFLIGTAMVIFGRGLYTMFVKSDNSYHQRKPRKLMLPSWLKMESVSEAKTRIGHAVLMILQVGMLDKFRTVPLVTGLDLALFAGALLLSSASIFCLSKLSPSEA